MAHADYDCCAICDCKLSYAGFYNARTKENICSYCLAELAKRGVIVHDTDELLDWLSKEDIRKVKAILEQLNFRCCYYKNSVDELLENRGIIFDKETGKIIGLKGIAVDLDGVILEYDKWKGIDHFGEPIPGAKESLQKLRNLGFKIIIYTTRVNKINTKKSFTQRDIIKLIEQKLKEYNIPFDEISTEKPLAKYYIDDRAIRFTNWEEVMDFIVGSEED